MVHVCAAAAWREADGRGGHLHHVCNPGFICSWESNFKLVTASSCVYMLPPGLYKCRAGWNSLMRRVLEKKNLLKKLKFHIKKRKAIPGQLLWGFHALSAQNIFYERRRILKLRSFAFRLPMNICSSWWDGGEYWFPSVVCGLKSWQTFEFVKCHKAFVGFLCVWHS